MADKTLTVNGQPFTFNRDRFAGVRTMTATIPLSDNTTQMKVTVTGTDSNGNDNSALSGTYTRGSTTATNWNQVGGNGSIYLLNGNWNFIDGSDGTPSFTISVDENVVVPWQIASSFAANNVTLSSAEETVTVDRTATVKSERAGASSPLLSKVVGGAAAAYSLRDLNEKGGHSLVVDVRNDSNVTKKFTAIDLVNGNLLAHCGSGNGFVEKWYDQSGNGNDATQATIGNQPQIVSNGALILSNGSPSVFFTGDTRDDELDFTDLTLTDASVFTVVNIDSSADQQIILGGSASTSTATMIPIMDDGSSSTQVYKNSTVGGAEQGSSQFKNGSQITLSNRNDAFDNLAVDSQILFTMLDLDVAEAKVLDGISRCPSNATTFHLQGKMSELIIYNSNQSANRPAIEANIANQYGITLS